MKLTSVLFALLMLAGASGCSRFCRSEMPAQQEVNLEIRKGGQIVADSVLKGARLFWLKEGGVRDYDSNQFGVYYPRMNVDAVDSTRPLLRSVSVAGVSVSESKQFYIEYADQSVDSVFIDYQPVTGKDNHCTYTDIVLKEIKYRGVNAPIDSSLMNQYQIFPVYILNK